MNEAQIWNRDLAIVLRRYGFLWLDVDQARGSISPALCIKNPAWTENYASPHTPCAMFVGSADLVSLPGVQCHNESPGGLLFDAARRRWFSSRSGIYCPLLPYVSFSRRSVRPIWTNAKRRSVLAWWQHGDSRKLLVGLQVVAELIRYTQGDPQQVDLPGDKTMWGTGDHECPAYLYQQNLAEGSERVPWADNLGFTLAQLLASEGQLPLLLSITKRSKRRGTTHR